MSTLSKLLRSFDFQVLNTNCYETIHTWEPDCNKAIAVAMPNGFMFSLKTYASFYLIATMLAKKDPRKVDWKRYVKDVLQSSVFLSTNLCLFLYFLCRFRHLLGFFTVYSMGGISSTLASYFAILIEKQSRRPALALYLTNLASETLYRQAAIHGYAPRFKNGECVPFGIGLVLFMHLYNKGRLHNSLKKFMNFTHQIEPEGEVLKTKNLPSEFCAFVNKLRTEYGRTEECEHQHSCVSVAAETFTKNFGIGLGVSSGLVLVNNMGKLFSQPGKVLKALFSSSNMKIPVFFGLMPLLYHSTNCLLARVPNTRAPQRRLIAAAVSSLAMSKFPNVTIAMYTLWKGIEAIYYDLVEQGKLSFVKHGDILLYSLATGYVLWMVILEPQAIRKGYFNFLTKLTGYRTVQFNRVLYDHWGYHSSKTIPFIPVLNTKYVTVNPSLYQGARPFDTFPH